jgi:predicted transcriptional regulator
LDENIAYSTIEEYLQRIVDKGIDEIRLFYEGLSKYEELKGEHSMSFYSKVEGIKNSIEDEKDKLGEYIVRVGPALLQKELYIDILKDLEKIAQNLDAAAYRLATLLSRKEEMDEFSHRLLMRITEKLLANMTHIMEALRFLSINPKNSISYCKNVIKIEGEVDELYRQLELRLFERPERNMIYLMLMKDVTDRLEDSVDLQKSIADSINYIAIQRS